MHQIALPIARTAAFLDDERPFADMPLMRLPGRFASAIGDTRATLEAQICLPTLPLAMLQMQMYVEKLLKSHLSPEQITGYMQQIGLRQSPLPRAGCSRRYPRPESPQFSGSRSGAPSAVIRHNTKTCRAAGLFVDCEQSSRRKAASL
jgi:hypothetical protein